MPTMPSLPALVTPQSPPTPPVSEPIPPSIPPELPKAFPKWIIAAVIIIFLGVAIFYFKQSLAIKQISGYEECIQAKGSLIQESYPAVCVTKSKQSFTQPISSPTPSPPLEEEPSQVKECYEKTSCEGPTPCMANPASLFCTCMGGELEIGENDQGQYGVCLIDGQEYDEWEYFRTMNPEDKKY